MLLSCRHEQPSPDLMREYACGEQVVCRLVVLMTKRTRRIRLKAVLLTEIYSQRRSWSASQKKNLTLGGTAALQMSFAPGSEVAPMKNALYVEDAV